MSAQLLAEQIEGNLRNSGLYPAKRPDETWHALELKASDWYEILAALRAQGEQGVVGWLHEDEGRYDLIHDAVKNLWIRAKGHDVVKGYTIPLYALPAPPNERAK